MGEKPGPKPGVPMSESSQRKRAFAAKRVRYAELREQGATSWEAAMEIGVDPVSGAKRYEHWLDAERRGLLNRGEP